MKLTSPKADAKFVISSAAEWPSIAFETDGDGPHEWRWSIVWNNFKKTGVAHTPGKQWDARTDVANCGGILTVDARAGEAGKPTEVAAAVTVNVIGTNPSEAEATAYLATRADGKGFDRILKQESGFRHFKNGEPIKSFDNGYGMCQLTKPVPTFEQIWNWKLNIDGGLALFAQKRSLALAYLGQSGRTCSADQLMRETVCRWNGGSYHEWDTNSGAWVRAHVILCDHKTGNIGWDMSRPANQGRTEIELHVRDSGTYNKPPGPAANWRYSGVCYADHVLG
ncbi:MAG: hypothetical protein JWR40_1237 [Massilia sp.]|jgi:hypothetical protein|nr:hypothetical protein [Massilia sp.]MDB5949725.1 hypothetical protein [Massilia sp.]